MSDWRGRSSTREIKSCLIYFILFFFSATRAPFFSVAAGIPEGFPAAVPLHPSRGATGSRRLKGSPGVVQALMTHSLKLEKETEPAVGPRWQELERFRLFRALQGRR